MKLIICLFLFVSFMSYVACEKFLYFAYGSNLLARRILINNPSAVFESTGKLANHRLDFTKYTTYWNGTVATIVEDTGEVVWGALWMLDMQHMQSLDRQEGVDVGFYFPKTVNITKPDGNTVQARTYEQTSNPSKIMYGERVPYERRPSKTYLKVILNGAIECGLPVDYIKKLSKISHNYRKGSEKVRAVLGAGF